jgi:hypothetical protein
MAIKNQSLGGKRENLENWISGVINDISVGENNWETQKIKTFWVLLSDA